MTSAERQDLFEKALGRLNAARSLRDDPIAESWRAQLTYLSSVASGQNSPDRLEEIVLGAQAAKHWGWGAAAEGDLEELLYACSAVAKTMANELKGSTH